MSVQVDSLLGQAEGEKKAFFGGCKKEDLIVRLPLRAFGFIRARKCLSFCKIGNKFTPSLTFIRVPHK